LEGTMITAVFQKFSKILRPNFFRFFTSLGVELRYRDFGNTLHIK